MTIKNITTILSGSNLEVNLLGYCEMLSKTLSARLNALHVSQEYEQIAKFALGAGGVSSDVYDGFKKSLEHTHSEKLFRAENLFDKKIKYKNSKFIHETGNIRDIVSYHGKHCDLIVLSSSIEERDEDYMGIVKSILFETGTPILLVPEKVKRNKVEKVLIAWDGSLRVSKAVRGGIDILKKAKEVLVVGVNESEKDVSSANHIIEYLNIHDIKASHLGVKKAHHSIGQTISDEVKNHGCDLLIMGAYTHNRVRQAILGGVTKHILSHPAIPVLMQY